MHTHWIGMVEIPNTKSFLLKQCLMYIYDQEISEALSWASAISCFMLFCGILSHNSK